MDWAKNNRVPTEVSGAINIHRLGRESYEVEAVSRESDSCCLV